MQAYTYVSKGKFELREKPKPTLMQERDAIVKVTLASICSSDLHIKHGSVPRAVPGITVGHEMVGIVEEVHNNPSWFFQHYRKQGTDTGGAGSDDQHRVLL